MTTVEAIKTYFGQDSRPVENKELLELRKHISIEEWQEMGKACAKALGHDWVATK
jgi:hypothetical protein